ncbi:MarR family winged helix-turn-helix transcriptional regulator [Gryllotalpicola koreensis]|uniref:MarR family transcriptional regulator n=1 Tax=Gryllotalpicola koreensis TaxID=993086 RepID=A0ABP8A9L4_9MICO
MTPSPAPELREIASRLRFGTVHLGHRLRTERGHESGLSGNKLLILSRLLRDGPSTPGRISAAEHVSPQALTRVFAELEAAQLIARHPDPDDARQSLLEVTESGAAAVSSDAARRDAWLADALAELTPAELAVLRLAAELMTRLAESP